jgi:hypothetical protein
VHKSLIKLHTEEAAPIWQKALLTTILVLVAWLVFSIGFYQVLVVARGYRFDFSYRWIAGRAALAGQDPYSQEVSRAIYRAMFEQEPAPDEYVQGFSNPAHHLLLFIPFYYLPFEVAVSLWAGLQLIFLFAAVGIGFYLLKNGKFPSLMVLIGLMLYCTWYRHTMIGLTFAQFIIFQLLLTLVVLLAAVHRWDWWCGVGLALTTNHPALSFVLVVVVLGLALLARRWKIIAGFGLGLAVLMAGSVLWLGWWVPGFLESTRRYAGRAPWLLADGGIGLQVLVVVTSIIIGGLAFIALRRQEHEIRLEGVALITGISLYLVPQTNSYNLTFLLLLVLIGWAIIRNRWLRLVWLGGWWLLPWLEFGTAELTLQANLWVVYVVTLIWGVILASKLWRRRPPNISG